MDEQINTLKLTTHKQTLYKRLLMYLHIIYKQ